MPRGVPATRGRAARSARFRHRWGVGSGVGCEQMFAEAYRDESREWRRAARRRELRSLCVEEARIKARVTQLVREADDDGDWQAEGCSSSAAWLAQVSSSDYRSAARITQTSDALRELPRLGAALGSGVLPLDQGAAAAEFATPETDARIARVAVGKAPGQIAKVARAIVPPVVDDDPQI